MGKLSTGNGERIMPEKDRSLFQIFGVIIIGIALAIAGICATADAQEPEATPYDDKVFEFTKTDQRMAMGQTEIIEGVWECIEVGTNLMSTGGDTVSFAILVQGINDPEPKVFGLVIILPDGRRVVDPKLTMVIDERIIVGVTLNAPIGTKFMIKIRKVTNRIEAEM